MKKIFYAILILMMSLAVSSCDEAKVEEAKGDFSQEVKIETKADNAEKETDKKNKKEKPEPLTDEELRPLVVSGINGLAQDNWSAAVKNDLYKWVMALYDPNRTVRKAHPVRSKLSVDGTFRKLAMSGNDPRVMIGMLCTAIEGGWQGVQVPSSGAKVVQPKPAEKERQYRCL